MRRQIVRIDTSTGSRTCGNHAQRLVRAKIDSGLAKRGEGCFDLGPVCVTSVLVRRRIDLAQSLEGRKRALPEPMESSRVGIIQ